LSESTVEVTYFGSTFRIIGLGADYLTEEEHAKSGFTGSDFELTKRALLIEEDEADSNLWYLRTVALPARAEGQTGIFLYEDHLGCVILVDGARPQAHIFDSSGESRLWVLCTEPCDFRFFKQFIARIVVRDANV
jgi:hypothetical protein